MRGGDGLIEIRRTGHFWIDNGICGLWQSLLSGAEEEPRRGPNGLSVGVGGCQVTLGEEALVLAGDPQALTAVQRDALAALKERLWRPTKAGKEWWYGPAAQLLPQMSNPDTFFVGVGQGSLGKIRPAVCDFCDREGPVKPVGTTEFPLLVTLEKMSSFYSELSEAQRVCSECAFASKFALVVALYHIQGGLLNAFFLDDADLLSLDRGIRAFSRLAAETAGLRNVPLSVVNVQYVNESLLSFLVAVLEAYKQRFPNDIDNLYAPRRLHLLAFSRSGKTTTVEGYAFVPNVAELVRIIEFLDWVDTNGKRRNALRAALYWMWFRADSKVDSTLREELCLRLKQRLDIAGVVAEAVMEALLVRDKPVSGYDSVNLKILVERYEREVMGIDATILKNTKDVGTMLGELAAETEEKSILYELRSTRNHEDFLEAIHHVLTRHLGELEIDRRSVEGVLRDVDEKNWKVFRSLTGIYAALEYAARTREESKAVGK